MRRPCVLIVEDADPLLELTISLFQDAGYETLPAHDGAEALALLAGPRAVDLLLTDIRLPGAVDGWVVAERARASVPELPVIYVTGYADEATRPVANSLLFRKPCRSVSLLDAARALGVGQGRDGLV